MKCILFFLSFEELTQPAKQLNFTDGTFGSGVKLLFKNIKKNIAAGRNPEKCRVYKVENGAAFLRVWRHWSL